MAIKGKVLRVRPSLKDERLKVVVRVRTGEGEEVDAFMPDRELSALLPRSVLMGDEKQAPRSLLKTLSAILKRSVQGRPVRLWQFREGFYCSFTSWRSVRFGKQSSGRRTSST